MNLSEERVDKMKKGPVSSRHEQGKEAVSVAESQTPLG